MKDQKLNDISIGNIVDSNTDLDAEMSRSELYVIYDKAAELASPPFPAENRAVARRQCINTVVRLLEPSDYALIKICEIDKYGQVYLCETEVHEFTEMFTGDDIARYRQAMPGEKCE